MLEWFRTKLLIANPGKLQFMVLGTSKVSSYIFFIDGVKVSYSKKIKLFEITIDSRKPPIRRPPKQYSKMRLSRQFQICLVFFMKRFRAHKNTHKQTLTNGTKLSKH